jgi:hypothetical protein
MLSKSTSLSKQINQLSLKHAYLFVTSIPHQDDWGRVTKDPEIFKGTVAPLRKEVSLRDCLEAIERFKEIELAIELSDCLFYPGFGNHQTLSPEKRAKSTFQALPIESPEIPRESQGKPVQDKGSEGKIREDKLLRKEQALEFNQSLFKGFKDAGIEIQDAAGERNKYPSLFRRKNPDVNYWLLIANFSQSYGFKEKHGGDYVYPWRGPVKLSKLYYEARNKYEEQMTAVAGKNRLDEMKKGVLKGMK